jgi:hypothetical protein
MITLEMHDEHFAVRQEVSHPLVYLDHCHLMNIAELEPARFAEILLRRDGTLAISWETLTELIPLSDRTATGVENLFLRIFPHVVFLKATPKLVIDEEDKAAAGQRVAPHLDGELPEFLVSCWDGESLNPLSPRGLLEEIRSLRLRSYFEEKKILLGKSLEKSQAVVQGDPSRMQRLRSVAPEATAPVAPTRYVEFAAVSYLLRSNTSVTNGHFFSDFRHTVVPLSYCDYVVLDKEWTAVARQIQRALERQGLLSHRAEVFNNISDLLDALEAGRSNS